MTHPTFTYEPITATSCRVRDAHTGEAYGVIHTITMYWTGIWYGPAGDPNYTTREDAAQALYRARYAHGFEAGAL